jgi:hypothetical protein
VHLPGTTPTGLKTCSTSLMGDHRQADGLDGTERRQSSRVFTVAFKLRGSACCAAWAAHAAAARLLQQLPRQRRRGDESPSGAPTPSPPPTGALPPPTPIPRLRAGLMACLFNQALLVRSADAAAGADAATLMGVDAGRVVNLVPSLQELWSMPVQLAVAMWLLYTQVGGAAAHAAAAIWGRDCEVSVGPVWGARCRSQPPGRRVVLPPHASPALYPAPRPNMHQEPQPRPASAAGVALRSALAQVNPRALAPPAPPPTEPLPPGPLRLCRGRRAMPGDAAHKPCAGVAHPGRQQGDDGPQGRT